jgi:hypothetical protein
MDGTFSTVPTFFCQLFTVHVRVCEIVVVSFNTFFMTDFEKAIVNAIKKVFPQATHKGCYFHVAKSLYRKVASLGLKRKYHCDPDFASALKQLSALTFVPQGFVAKTF